MRAYYCEQLQISLEYEISVELYFKLFVIITFKP